jgi:hypothetical protein
MGGAPAPTLDFFALRGSCSTNGPSCLRAIYRDVMTLLGYDRMTLLGYDRCCSEIIGETDLSRSCIEDAESEGPRAVLPRRRSRSPTNTPGISPLIPTKTPPCSALAR